MVPDVKPVDEPPDLVDSRLGKGTIMSSKIQGGGGSNSPNKVKPAKEFDPPKETVPAENGLYRNSHASEVTPTKKFDPPQRDCPS